MFDCWAEKHWKMTCTPEDLTVSIFENLHLISDLLIKWKFAKTLTVKSSDAHFILQRSSAQQSNMYRGWVYSHWKSQRVHVGGTVVANVTFYLVPKEKNPNNSLRRRHNPKKHYYDAPAYFISFVVVSAFVTLSLPRASRLVTVHSRIWASLACTHSCACTRRNQKCLHTSHMTNHPIAKQPFIMMYINICTSLDALTNSIESSVHP